MTHDNGQIQVELFGVPRLLTQRRSVTVSGQTLAEVASALLKAYPALAHTVFDPATGWLNEGYIFVVGDRFVRAPQHPVTSTDSLLLVSSVAGG